MNKKILILGGGAVRPCMAYDYARNAFNVTAVERKSAQRDGCLPVKSEWGFADVGMGRKIRTRMLFGGQNLLFD
jgi:hypothetical protein